MMLALLGGGLFLLDAPASPAAPSRLASLAASPGLYVCGAAAFFLANNLLEAATMSLLSKKMPAAWAAGARAARRRARAGGRGVGALAPSRHGTRGAQRWPRPSGEPTPSAQRKHIAGPLTARPARTPPVRARPAWRIGVFNSGFLTTLTGLGGRVLGNALVTLLGTRVEPAAMNDALMVPLFLVWGGVMVVFFCGYERFVV
jgi:hypothetical protein